MPESTGERAEGTDLRAQTRFSFQDVFEGLASALRFEEMLDCILSVALRELEADEGSLMLLAGQDGTELQMLASRGLPEEVRARGYVSRPGSITERVIAERQPLIVNGPLASSESPPSSGLAPRSVRSALCVPLLARGRLLGTMNINRTRSDRALFGAREQRIAEILASQAAMVIENHRLHEELVQQERLAAVGQVVAGIAHCVKNLLAGVQGGLGLVQMGADSDDRELLRKGTEILGRSVAMLSHLILDLLEVSKERRPIRQTFAVSDLLESLRDLLAWKAEMLGVALTVEAEGGDFCLAADRDQLTRALLNFALNALEACHEKSYDVGERPAVCVRARKKASQELDLAPPEREQAAEWIVFEISDNGPGIPAEAVPHLWDLFYSTKGSKGTGIGLPAARKVVSEHGGKIFLDTDPARGTTFTVLLPLVGTE